MPMTQVGSPIGATKTWTYNGSRKLKDVENFHQVMEGHFGEIGLEDDSVRIYQASLYLVDNSLSS